MPTPTQWIEIRDAVVSPPTETEWRDCLSGYLLPARPGTGQCAQCKSMLTCRPRQGWAEAAAKPTSKISPGGGSEKSPPEGQQSPPIERQCWISVRATPRESDYLESILRSAAADADWPTQVRAYALRTAELLAETSAADRSDKECTEDWLF